MAARAKVGNALCFGRGRMRVQSRPALAKLTDEYGGMMAELPIRSVAGRAAACVAELRSSANSWLNALACVHDRPADASDGDGWERGHRFRRLRPIEQSGSVMAWCGISSTYLWRIDGKKSSFCAASVCVHLHCEGPRDVGMRTAI